MTARTPRFLLSAVLALPLFLTSAGGWAVITVEDLPDYVVAQRPVTLAFTVRQHGQTPLTGLRPTIEARAGRVEAEAVGVAGTEDGRYTATLTLPEAGEWIITIHSGFGPSEVTLAPMRAVSAQAAAPAALADAERGRRLFVAKGCVTCHLHGDVPGSGVVNVGPELTTRRFAGEYLRMFLANPAIRPPNPQTGARMPNLRLAPREIAALAAFINGEQRAGSQ